MKRLSRFSKLRLVGSGFTEPQKDGVTAANPLNTKGIIETAEKWNQYVECFSAWIHTPLVVKIK